jgi:malonyl-CoA decarboxylase
MAEGMVVRGCAGCARCSPRGAPRGLEGRQLAAFVICCMNAPAASAAKSRPRQRAGRLAETYLRLNDEGRATFLRIVATEFGPDPQQVAKAHADYQAAIGSDAQWAAESAAQRHALVAPAHPDAIQYPAPRGQVPRRPACRPAALVETDPRCARSTANSSPGLSAWFDVGFLELQRITWSSPAALLEKLIEYEAVHEIRSWSDLKNRLDSDRRCYAFFHPRMPMEPLIFVEVALTDHLADNVQTLLDEHAPVFDAQRASTAIFYSISNTQIGLRGVSFGNFLLKRVVDDLKRDYPRLVSFATLSPLPSLRRWSEKTPDAWQQAFNRADIERIKRHLAPEMPAPDGADDLPKLLADDRWANDERLARAAATRADPPGRTLSADHRQGWQAL